MTKSPLLLALAVVASSGAASANVVASDGVASREELPGPPRRLEGRIGMLLGGADVGDVNGFSIGLTTGIGYRIGDVTLRGRFDYYRVGDSPDEAVVRRGRGARLGGAVRYSFASTSDDQDSKGIGLDFWGEAGAGIEHVAWLEGGVLDRPSGELAVGFDFDGYGKRDAHRRRRHVGYFMAFRSMFGQGPESAGPAMCAGPCTRATKPSRLDIDMFFELGLHWGH